MALELIQPLGEMSTRNLPGGQGRPGRRANILTVSQPYGSSRPVTGVALLFFFFTYGIFVKIDLIISLRQISEGFSAAAYIQAEAKGHVARNEQFNIMFPCDLI
jgi:hypothetical protein